MGFLPVAAGVAGLFVLGGCGATVATGTPCSTAAEPVPLPAEVPESSGVVASHSAPGLYWTHNDSGWDPELFAVDGAGELRATVRVTGAENRDWEDIAAGPCPEAHRCLYIADTGDNRLQRDTLVIYRVPEPPARDGATPPAKALPITLPHGPRDIEALYVLGKGSVGAPELHLLTKGRAGPVEHYRYPGAPRPGTVVEVEKLGRLSERRPPLPRMVTGAAADAGGRWVAVRTYEELRFHRTMDDGSLAHPPEARVNLRPLWEPQGEAVTFGTEDEVVLTSEAGPGGSRGVLNRLRCRLPPPPDP